jgi:hypothetical protein
MTPFADNAFQTVWRFALEGEDFEVTYLKVRTIDDDHSYTVRRLSGGIWIPVGGMERGVAIAAATAVLVNAKEPEGG